VNIIIAAILLSSCAKVGSEAWCEQMKDKDRGEWTVNEATDFTRHCILKMKK
jgi:hypothetical protein